MPSTKHTDDCLAESRKRVLSISQVAFCLRLGAELMVAECWNKS